MNPAKRDWNLMYFRRLESRSLPLTYVFQLQQIAFALEILKFLAKPPRKRQDLGNLWKYLEQQGL